MSEKSQSEQASLKFNQYKVTIYAEPGGVTRVEVWWYEDRPNEVTGEIQKHFTWATHRGCLSACAQWLGDFFGEHYPIKEAAWPMGGGSKDRPDKKDSQESPYSVP